MAYKSLVMVKSQLLSGSSFDIPHKNAKLTLSVSDCHFPTPHAHRFIFRFAYFTIFSFTYY